MDGQCGLSASSNKAGNLWIWAGYNGPDDFDFVVNNGGQAVARDFVISGSGSVSDKLDRLESQIDDLQNQIDNIDTGGGA